MTLLLSSVFNLLADCRALGVRLLSAGDGNLTIDAPRAALTPDLLGRLKTHKAELLALLQHAAGTTAAVQKASEDSPGTDANAENKAPGLASAGQPAAAVCRCGAATWHDMPIHDGQSIRRDCAGCRRFIDFPIWYGESTLLYEKHA